MNMRFSTQAANADFLGEDTPDPAEGVGADGTPRDPKARKARPHARTSPRREPGDEAKPGKDINAAGFVKDNDDGKP